jgi:hypothetical protein
MLSEEIFYCDIPVDENYPATKLKCYAYKDNNIADADGYYKFCVDENEYLAYYRNCQIKTLDQEDDWICNLFYAIADTVFKKFNISFDEDNDNGFWQNECVPTMVFNYAYHDYNEWSDYNE